MDHEQRDQYDDRRREAWAEFCRTLSAAKTVQDAAALVRKAPRPGDPGGSYYSNLAFFLQHNFTAPAGANADERSQYLAFVRRVLKPGESMVMPEAPGKGTV